MEWKPRIRKDSEMKRIALTDRDGTPRNPQCRGGRCPAVFETGDGQLVVQGFRLSDEDRRQLDIPGDEDAVRIPKTLIDQLLGRS